MVRSCRGRFPRSERALGPISKTALARREGGDTPPLKGCCTGAQRSRMGTGENRSVCPASVWNLGPRARNGAARQRTKANTGYDQCGMTVRITEAELARDVRAVMEKVEQGSEVIIEQEDHRPVAVIHALRRSGRPITEILTEARKRNSTATLDEDFGTDLEEIIASHQQPWQPPSWD